MISTGWTAFKALGAGKKIFLLLAIAGVIFAAVKIGQHFIDGNNEAQRDLGAAQTANDYLEETFERTEKANEAAETILTDPSAAKRNCMQHSRTPENC